jgi:hypothetical protein
MGMLERVCQQGLLKLLRYPILGSGNTGMKSGNETYVLLLSLSCDFLPANLLGLTLKHAVHTYFWNHPW